MKELFPQLSQSQFGGIRKRSPEDLLCVLRLIADYCRRYKLCFILFIADIMKAFDWVDPDILIIILYEHYKIDGNLLRFTSSILLGNILIIKNGKLYSAPIKAKRSTQQGA